MAPDEDLEAQDPAPDEMEDVAQAVDDAPIGPGNETPEDRPDVEIGDSVEF